MSTDPLDDDLDRELSAAGARWRGAQGAPPMVDPNLFERTATRRRSRFTASAIAAAVALIAGGIMLATSASRHAGTTAPIAPAAPASSPASADPTIESPTKTVQPVPPMVCSVVVGTAPAEASASGPGSTGNSEAEDLPCSEPSDGASGWCTTFPAGAAATDEGAAPSTVAPGCSYSSGSCSVDGGSDVVTCVTCDGTLAPGPEPTAGATASPTGMTSLTGTITATGPAPSRASTDSAAAAVPPCAGSDAVCPAGATCTFCPDTGTGAVGPADRTDADESESAGSVATVACASGGSDSEPGAVPSEPTGATTAISARPVPPSTVTGR